MTASGAGSKISSCGCTTWCAAAWRRRHLDPGPVSSRWRSDWSMLRRPAWLGWFVIWAACRIGPQVHPAQRSVGWPERMLIELGRLALVLNAARQLDSLEPDLRAEVRTLIGIAEGRADVLATEPIRDAWDVLGSRRIVGDRLSVQRTWLWGQRTARWALLLDFSVAGQPFGQSPAPGARIEADLCFYSGTARLRALIKEPPVLLGDVSSLPSQPIDRVLRAFAEALGRNPWQERIPAAVRDVVPHRAGAESWCAIGADGTRLPLAGPTGWHLLALSGGHPLDVFGEWDGFSFWPLSAMVEGRLTSLRAPAAA